MRRIHVVILELNAVAKYKILSTKNTITFSQLMVFVSGAKAF
jgi:hypothetical protein